MDLFEKTLKSETLYRGKIINLRKDRVLLPDGRESDREVIEHPGGACVLCVREGKVVLVRQFRYVYGEELWEIPAGKLNPGEDPMAAAGRELEEETGLTAEALEPLFVLYPTPGYTNEKLYVFEAHGVGEGKQRLDEDEFLFAEEFPLEEAERMIADGRIRDGKTVAALLAYLCREKRGSHGDR